MRFFTCVLCSIWCMGISMGYPKQVYQRAGEELARRREAARGLNEVRAAEIAAKLPEITRLQREMAATAISVTKLVMAASGDIGAEIGKLKEKNLALQNRRAELLTAAGYPADYLDEQKSCSQCGGSGYVGPVMCGCFRELLKREACSELHSVSQAERCSFESFELGFYPEDVKAHMAGILSDCKAYAECFSIASPSLLMLGHTGLGKTHLSLAIASAVTEQGFGVVYVPAQKLLDKLESAKFSYSPESKEQYARDLNNVLQCDLLVLDDLGAEFGTGFSSSALYNIVNTRLVESRPTIVSTNLDPAEIETKYSPRMLSRLVGGYRAMKFFGKDIRFLKKIR